MLKLPLNRRYADSAPAALCHLSYPFYASRCRNPSTLLPWRAKVPPQPPVC